MLNDMVDHPAHYADKKIEVIDYIEDTISAEEFYGYCVGNILKYVSRAKKKHDTPVVDLRKAAWYLNKLIETLEGEN